MLPQTLIHAAGQDPLRHKAVQLEAKLRLAGTTVHATLGTGMPHALVRAESMVPDARRQLVEFCAAIGGMFRADA
jgi:acetyl esterase/lipase